MHPSASAKATIRDSSPSKLQFWNWIKVELFIDSRQRALKLSNSHLELERAAIQGAPGHIDFGSWLGLTLLMLWINTFSGCPLTIRLGNVHMTRPSTASSDSSAGFLTLVLLHTTSNALLDAHTGQFFKVA